MTAPTGPEVAGAKTSFLPSQVVLQSMPLVGTMGRCEREFAAALIVRTCVVNGDRWQAVTPKMVGEMLDADAKNKFEPVCGWQSNPFLRPDFWELIDEGYAEGGGQSGEPISLTEKALTVIRQKWVRRATPQVGG